MSSNSPFMQRVLAGESPNSSEVINYIIAFHERHPNSTSQAMKLLRTSEGRTSYQILADVVASARPESILDAGCGDGTLMVALRARCPLAQLYGIDIATGDLALAGALLLGDEHADLRRGDVTALPFPDASLDAIASHLVFMLLPDLDSAIAEAYRVLRPGGTLALLLPRTPDGPTAFGMLQTMLHAIIRERHPHFAPHSLGDRITFNSDGMSRRLEVAGFSGVAQIEDITVEGVLDASELWRQLQGRYLLGSLDPPSTAELRGRVMAFVGPDGFRYEEALRVLSIRR